VRSLLIAGAASFDELFVHLRILEPPFQTSVKDLRYVFMMHCRWDRGRQKALLTERITLTN
jgi:hypothetical protein